ncbi:peptide deformylase [Geminicoccaceae bacterium 1502E]|nr:peptide deformylase [Geminicoccaceae bacterium 1502E]
MTLLKIARLGHPVLLQPAMPVADPRAPEMQRLAADMVETMLDARGLGLAAPQVHQSLRLLVALPIAAREEPRDVAPLVLFNPELEPAGEEREEGLEGCLSIPGLRGFVPRWRTVRWRGLDFAGEPVEGVAEGLFARVLQHEVDHLDGILYLARMSDTRRLAFEAELPHLMEWMDEHSSGGDGADE